MLTECENATSAVADSIRGAAGALVDVRRMKDEVGGRWGDFLTAMTPALFVLIDERVRQDMHAERVAEDAAVDAESDAYLARVYAREGITPRSRREV